MDSGRIPSSMRDYKQNEVQMLVAHAVLRLSFFIKKRETNNNLYWLAFSF